MEVKNEIIKGCVCGGGEFSVKIVKSKDHPRDYRVRCHRCLRSASESDTIQGATDRWNEEMERKKHDD